LFLVFLPFYGKKWGQKTLWQSHKAKGAFLATPKRKNLLGQRVQWRTAPTLFYDVKYFFKMFCQLKTL
jgi:hypothetical protein